LETPHAGLAKIEGLLMPVTAGFTFFKEDIPYLFNGDVGGLVTYEVNLLKQWHPPTLLGLSNMVKATLAPGAMTALGGWAIEEVGKTMGSGLIAEIGVDFKHIGQGMLVGGLADGLARPAKYNPGGGPGMGVSDSIAGVSKKPNRGQGTHDSVMWSPNYERTSYASDAPMMQVPR
jgi:hypothetical protein